MRLIIRDCKDGGVVISDTNNVDIAAFGCTQDGLEYIKGKFERCKE